jgi:hypothetical protein
MPEEGVVAVTEYHVTARRWAHGWELHIDGVGVTQSRTLASAERIAVLRVSAQRVSQLINS